MVKQESKTSKTKNVGKVIMENLIKIQQLVIFFPLRPVIQTIPFHTALH